MGDGAAGRVLRVVDRKHRAGELDAPAVADLPAAFGVKRRTVGDHNAAFAFAQFPHRLPRLVQQRQRFHRALQFVVAGEFGLADAVQRGDFGLATADIANPATPAEATRGARAGTLRGHAGVEGRGVDGQVVLARDVGGQVQRETVSVVEFERGFAGDFGAGADGIDGAVEDFDALPQGLGELVVFPPQRLLHQRGGRSQLRAGIAHLIDQRAHQLVHKRFAAAELVTVANRAADDAAQYITAAFVGRNHTVGDEERGRANMVGDDLQ